MIPKLHDKDGNKICDLNDLLECKVIEERNGLFDLALVYPAGYPYADDLVKENIIVARANDTLLNQKFRIYNIKKMTKNRIKVLARHISFDIAYDFIKNIDITNQSCEYALNTIFRNSQFSRHYRGYSNIINAQNYKISKVNCLKAIAGAKGSIIDTFGTGAEILRDNTDIYVLNSRGHDNGVTIEYKKNLTGFELEEDTTDLETRVGGFAKYTNEAGEETIVESDWIDSTLINSYVHPYIRADGPRDYSDKFKDDEIPTKEKLNNLCGKEFTDNKRDITKQNFKIEFIPLSKCVGYEGIEDKISLCDKVTIKHSVYATNAQAKVIKATYNVLTERYESMELGEPKTTLNDIVGDKDNPQQGPPGLPGADGVTTYTWIKYADDQYGNGINNSPDDKKYIGFAYNKATATESSIKTDYVWSLIKGTDGVKGEDGIDGTTYYTWIKYSDNADGSSLYDTPTSNTEYIGIATNKLTATESNTPSDYKWSKFKGDNGVNGSNGTDGLSVFITYHDSVSLPTLPTGNGTTGGWHTNATSTVIWMSQKVSSSVTSGVWGEPIKIKGEPGLPGQPGEEFPDTIPATPTLIANVYGFASIELNWTFESKVYYTYEVYSSKTNNFTPNSFDLICEGQVSSFLFQAKPGETWYFRVCGKNSYGKRTAFSTQVSAITTKVDDLSNYVAEMSIGDALIGTLSFDRGWAGTLVANYIDARNLSVTDGDGLRTLDIDSYGNVNLNVASLKIIGRNVATEESVNAVAGAVGDLEQANKDNVAGIEDIKNNGVSKVKNSIIDIGNHGIKVGREGSQFENLQSETGNYMHSYGKEIARYDKDGLKTSYAVLERAQVGHLRFENGANCQQIHYIEDLSIGGITIAEPVGIRSINNYEGWEV